MISLRTGIVPAICLVLAFAMLPTASIAAPQDDVKSLARVVTKGKSAERLSAMDKIAEMGLEGAAASKALVRRLRAPVRKEEAVRIVNTLIAIGYSETDAFERYKKIAFKQRGKKYEKAANISSYLAGLSAVSPVSDSMFDSVVGLFGQKNVNFNTVPSILATWLAERPELKGRILELVDTKTRLGIKVFADTKNYSPDVVTKIKANMSEMPVDALNYLASAGASDDPEVLAFALKQIEGTPPSLMNLRWQNRNWKAGLAVAMAAAPANRDAHRKLVQLLSGENWESVASSLDGSDLLADDEVQAILLGNLAKRSEQTSASYGISNTTIFSKGRQCELLASSAGDSAEVLSAIAGLLPSLSNVDAPICILALRHFSSLPDNTAALLNGRIRTVSLAGQQGLVENLTSNVHAGKNEMSMSQFQARVAPDLSGFFSAYVLELHSSGNDESNSVINSWYERQLPVLSSGIIRNIMYGSDIGYPSAAALGPDVKGFVMPVTPLAAKLDTLEDPDGIAAVALEILQGEDVASVLNLADWIENADWIPPAEVVNLTIGWHDKLSSQPMSTVLVGALENAEIDGSARAFLEEMAGSKNHRLKARAQRRLEKLADEDKVTSSR